jgi:aryl-alcohol dehydrogenase-like predicted oxidoreductase
LDRAWELGETNWDTSDIYGDCESLLGKWFKLHPERRADIFLATKFAIKAVPSPTSNGGYDLAVDNSPEYMRACLEKSLKAMGVDSVDLYYVHRIDAKIPIETTMKAMLQLKT